MTSDVYEKAKPKTSGDPDQQDAANEQGAGVGIMFKRLFTYCTALDITLNLVGATAAAGSGVALALVQLAFGDFVTVISDFQRGLTTRDDFNSQIVTYTLRFVYIFIARFVLTYVFIACFTVSGIRISRTVRKAFLTATLRQEVAYFDSGEGGSVTMKVTTNGNQLQNGISDKLGSTVQAIAACVAAVAIGLVVQWKLMLITITIAPVMIIVIGVVVAFVTKIESRQLEIFSTAGALAEDIVGSIRNVQAFWMRPRLVKRYDEYLDRAHAEGNKQSVAWGFMFSIEYFCIYAGFALAFWQGIRMYNSGEIQDPGDIVAVLFSVVIAATSLTMISPFFQTFAIAASAAESLFKVIDRTSHIDPLQEGGQKLNELRGEIELRNVNFEYPTRAEVPVLKDYSIHCEPGKTTALVGASGSGKSTIVGLLERWYNPRSGTMTLDGHRIESLNLRWLRTKVRLVQQEPVLLNGTVLDNVLNGLTGTPWEHAPRDEQVARVVEACKMAYAHDFVSDLPDGYDTNVGERAGLLSGGQKQRIAIARALVSDPKILLLDEATSALDPHSEGIVQQALDRAASGRTTIVIAHKLATIKNADKIVVMQRGEVLETGTHDSLLAQNGVYTRLVGAQDLGQASPGGASSDDENDEREKPFVELTKTQTTASASEQQQLSDYQQSLDYDKHKARSLISVVIYVLREQKALLLRIGLPWIVGCLIGGATFPAQAVILSQLIDIFSFTGADLLREGNFYALMFFVVALANLFAYWSLGFVSNIIAQTIGHFYRRVLMDVTLQQDVQFFDRAENTTGAVTSRLTTMPTQITELFGFNLSIIFVVIINLISSSVLGLAFGWKLSLVLIFGGLPFLVGSGYLKIRLETAMAKQTAAKFTDSAGLAGEAVAAIRTISSLAMEQKTIDRFGDKVDGILKDSMPFIVHSSFWYALSQSAEFGVLALGFWYGCTLVASGEYSVRQFFLVFVAVFFSGQAAGQFFSYATSITKGVGAINYIIWLRSIQPIVAETNTNHNFGPSSTPESFAVNDAEFTYPTRPKDRVLRGISLSATKGAFIALVGGSGSGKSTIISLLERFYDPSTGTVSLNDQSIATHNPRLYRAPLSLVQQEPTLYQGTIRDNIALGSASTSDSLDVSDDKIAAVCKAANISDFVASLPEGLNTQVGNRGLSLSGGQRQRIAIARALVRDPKILLLDEATSALDTESERVVQAALSEAASEGGRITVAVAHRLSTIRDAQRIFVFVRGRVVEVGSHEELVRRGGVYAGMCKAQSLDREV
ncbi:Leptomycin B resistance protein pmd1 [Sphaceloma murrayae]|uniref:Leptomycin B resistance protein pmd1 n=1 Tax=Sphaceloma murrayae TaxID=2082308 RepID=A0A2K1QJ50_9PEZI|nr:Leptomycin B resistance protein pmd1 [Sphaceloma murrayae]